MQGRAGVRDEAARLVGMLGPPRLDGAAGRFLSAARFVALTGRDGTGRLWTSVVSGPPGFLRVAGERLVVTRGPDPADPLSSMQAGGQVGLIAIEFGIRRRFRVNGTLVRVLPGGFTMDVDQTFGNCPSYIADRTIDPDSGGPAPGTPNPSPHSELTQPQIEQVRTAEAFFLGTAHPTRGLDTSHKGGRRGFVRVESDGSIWWPDYSGNNLFNSLGNLLENPEAAAAFLDFATGTVVHVSGRAQVVDVPVAAPGTTTAPAAGCGCNPTRLCRPAYRYAASPASPSRTTPG